jgi:hypothetical protein
MADAYKKWRVTVSFETIVESETQADAERMAQTAGTDYLPLSGGGAFEDEYPQSVIPTFSLSGIKSEEF